MLIKAAQIIDLKCISYQIRQFTGKYDFSWAELFTDPLDGLCFGVIV